MLRRMAAALAIAASPLAIVLLDDPAQAQDVCVGTGRLHSERPVYLPTSGPTSFGSFFGTTDVGACAGGPNLAFGGDYAGDCLTVSASGVTNRGDVFNATAVGGIFVFNGDLVGVAQAFPDTVGGHRCDTGAREFLFHYSFVTQSGSPGPTIPPLPGGPAEHSDDCGGSFPVRTTVEGEDVKLIHETSGPTTIVCVRVGTASGFGGKLVVTPPTPDSGWTPPVPTTDSDVEACADTPGNTIPGEHPAVAGSGPVEHLIDLYSGPAGTFVCLTAANVSVRLIISPPTAPSLGNPDADWHPDPGTG